MAGARKQRAQRAKKEERSSQATSDSSKQAKSGERSTPTSVPRLDGNRDPIGPSHPIVNNRRLELDTSMYDLNNQEVSSVLFIAFQIRATACLMSSPTLLPPL